MKKRMIGGRGGGIYIQESIKKCPYCKKDTKVIVAGEIKDKKYYKPYRIELYKSIRRRK